MLGEGIVDAMCDVLGLNDRKDHKHGKEKLRVTGPDFPGWQRNLRGRSVYAMLRWELEHRRLRVHSEQCSRLDYAKVEQYADEYVHQPPPAHEK